MCLQGPSWQKWDATTCVNLWNAHLNYLKELGQSFLMLSVVAKLFQVLSFPSVAAPCLFFLWWYNCLALCEGGWSHGVLQHASMNVWTCRKLQLNRLLKSEVEKMWFKVWKHLWSSGGKMALCWFEYVGAHLWSSWLEVQRAELCVIILIKLNGHPCCP